MYEETNFFLIGCAMSSPRSRALCFSVCMLGLVPCLGGLLASRADDAEAQAWKPPPTAFECRFTELPIKIDGKGDDQAWRQAQVIDNFYLPWLAASRSRT